MRQFLPPIRFTGATVLRDGALQQRSVAVAEGRITKGPLPEVDLSGYLILPGIIDLHGDAFERHIAPRPSAAFPIETGLAATDRDAAANGVTTAWLAQSWSWEGGLRGPEYAEKLMSAVHAYRTHALTDLRVQIRCETHTVSTAAHLLDCVDRYGIDYVVFNNHLDEAVRLSHSRPEEILIWAKKAGRTAKEHMAVVEEAKLRDREVPRFLCALADAFDTRGIRYGSHDDPDGETRERFSMIGARICEFPVVKSAAAAARAVGDPVLMGAPNIVRGGSQSGNISAAALVDNGLCNALVSDYHYPSLAQAAFKLERTGLRTLPQAWAMISEIPADILGLSDRGVIDYGKRADLVVINAQTQAVEMTVSAGRVAYLAGEVAHRMWAGLGDGLLAAE